MEEARIAGQTVDGDQIDELADEFGDFVVFNIAGNKYRLIASIHFNRGKVYIRHVLTHQAYDRGEWTT